VTSASARWAAAFAVFCAVLATALAAVFTFLALSCADPLSWDSVLRAAERLRVAAAFLAAALLWAFVCAIYLSCMGV
jgi:hypothetical protein